MRALGLLVALVSLMAGALEARPLDSRTCREGGRSPTCIDPGTGGNSAPPPLLRILPTNGVGLPVMHPEDVCSAFAGELVGNYVCLRGDGTSVLGSGVTLTNSGSVSTSTPRVCPNGPDCGAISTQTFDGVGAWTANQSAAPAGNFSMCVLARVKREAVYPSPVLLSASTRLLFGATTLTWQVGGSNNNTSMASPTGRWLFACGTYRRVGAGSSVAISYMDGAVGNTVSSFPLPDAGAFPFTVGSQSATSGLDVALALYTEKELSAATISSMSAMVHGSALTAEDGSAVTYSRVGVASCQAPDGSILQQRGGWPCITKPAGFGGAALQVEGQRTNVFSLSQQLDSWSLGFVTVTANNIQAPDGSWTAETVTDTTSNSEHTVGRTPTISGGVDHVVSVYVKAGTAPYLYVKYHNLAAGFMDVATGLTTDGDPTKSTSSSVQLAGGWWRFQMRVLSSVAIANPSMKFGPSENLIGSYVGTGTGTIVLWGAQMESAALASTYIRADGTATARQATAATVAMPAGMTNAQGCGGASILSAGDDTNLGRVIAFGSGLERALGHGAPATMVDIGDGASALATVGADAKLGVVDASGSWSGAVMWSRSGSTRGADAAFDGTILASPVAIGAASGGAFPFFGYISNIRLGDAPNACN